MKCVLDERETKKNLYKKFKVQKPARLVLSSACSKRRKETVGIGTTTGYGLLTGDPGTVGQHIQRDKIGEFRVQVEGSQTGFSFLWLCTYHTNAIPPTSAVGKALVRKGQFSAFAGSSGPAQSLASWICELEAWFSMFSISSSEVCESAMILKLSLSTIEERHPNSPFQ